MDLIFKSTANYIDDGKFNLINLKIVSQIHKNELLFFLNLLCLLEYQALYNDFKNF